MCCRAWLARRRRRPTSCWPAPLVLTCAQSLLVDGHLAELAGLHRLEQLSLRGCSRLSGHGLAHLGALRGSLTMASERQAGPGLPACIAGVAAAATGCCRAAFALLARPPHHPSRPPTCLQLNLSNCTGLSDECLGVLAAAVPQLATLNLQGCSRLGDDGVAHLATMPTLRHVLLPAGVTDAAMHMLTEMPGGCWWVLAWHARAGLGCSVAGRLARQLSRRSPDPPACQRACRLLLPLTRAPHPARPPL